MEIENSELKSRKPRRTHNELTETLFSAVSSMLRDQKFREIGINDLTEFAQIEKNFIYKHYGDIDGVLREYVKRNDYWGKAVISPETYMQLTIKEIFSIMLGGLYQSFSDNVDFQNIIRWEIASSNEYVKENAKQREIESIPLKLYVDYYYEKYPDRDLACLFAIVSAGIYYLILHKNISTFVGIDFSDRKQADRIVGVINYIAELYFEDYVKTKKVIDKLYARNLSIQEIADILDISVEDVDRIYNNKKEMIS